MRFQRDLLKGTTETLVLALLREAPSHGYELVERLRQRSEGVFELGEGTLYPLLYKLEDKGLIAGKWEAGSGERRKRVYRITPGGREQLTQRSQEWKSLVHGMSLVLGVPAHA
jgi:PadR family transcriptional regulator PadR